MDNDGGISLPNNMACPWTFFQYKEFYSCFSFVHFLFHYASYHSYFCFCFCSPFVSLCIISFMLLFLFYLLYLFLVHFLFHYELYHSYFCFCFIPCTYLSFPQYKYRNKLVISIEKGSTLSIMERTLKVTVAGLRRPYLEQSSQKYLGKKMLQRQLLFGRWNAMIHGMLPLRIPTLLTIMMGKQPPAPVEVLRSTLMPVTGLQLKRESTCYPSG